MDKKQAFAFLDKLQGKGIKLGLSRVKKFLKGIGSPEKNFAIVHVGGTNGKGSTSAMIESILRQSGCKTGLYTSPHLIKFNERIKVNGKDISDKRLVSLVSSLKAKMSRAKVDLTYFEFVTAMAFQHFSDSGVDVAVVEVGLGGRLDATNVILPVVCAITNVEAEHEQALGKTIQEIAWEKAGIIKRGVPVVTSEKKEVALCQFRKRCRLLGTNLIQVKALYRGRLSLLGKFQRTNAALAVAVIRQLRLKGFEIPEAAVKKGLASTSWPGRLQLVKKCPAVVLDCAHNPACCGALAGSFRKLFPGKRVILVLGVSSDKNALEMARALAPVAKQVIVTNASFRAMSIGRLADCFLKTRHSAQQVPGVKDAVKKALLVAGRGDVVLVTGSCFVVGEALRLFDE